MIHFNYFPDLLINCCVSPLKYLRDKNAELEEKYKNTNVPMPDYW